MLLVEEPNPTELDDLGDPGALVIVWKPPSDELINENDAEELCDEVEETLDEKETPTEPADEDDDVILDETENALPGGLSILPPQTPLLETPWTTIFFI